tara:strand:- start:8 stop:820 length:813 start_codon:yes stop_codon:yes gene_type:complete
VSGAIPLSTNFLGRIATVQSTNQTSSVNDRLSSALARTSNIDVLTDEILDAALNMGMDKGQLDKSSEDWKEAVRKTFTYDDTDAEDNPIKVIDGDAMYAALTKMSPDLRADKSPAEIDSHEKRRSAFIYPIQLGMAMRSDVTVNSGLGLDKVFGACRDKTPAKIGNTYGEMAKTAVQTIRKDANYMVHNFLKPFKPKPDAVETEVETKTMSEIVLTARDDITAFEVIPDGVNMHEVGSLIQNLFLAVGGTPEEWAEADGSDADDIESDDE